MPDTAFATRIHTPAGQPLVVVDRVVDAPRALVFRMYADPAQLVRFWGPHGSTTRISEFDFRPGGLWRMVITFPGGFDVPMTSRFVEIAEPSRIVFRDVPPDPASGMPHHEMLVSIDFSEDGGRTRILVQVTFASVETRDAAVANGFVRPIAESMERLEALVAAR